MGLHRLKTWARARRPERPAPPEDGLINFTRLSVDPLIFLTATSHRSEFLGDLPQIAARVGNRPFTALISGQWSLAASRPKHRARRLRELAAFQQAYPRAQIIQLCNEAAELEVFDGGPVEAIHVNHNAFIDENVFYPHAVPKRFDAVYVGQLMRWKRHMLARRIQNIALIYYGRDFDYLADLVAAFPDAEFPNNLPQELGGPGVRFLTQGEVAAVMNASRVGLCLSRIEGAMYAATEYLLCGLPVVSTENQGGRNDFLSPTVSRIVPAEEDAVYEAVQHYLTTPPDPFAIRAETLGVIRQFRTRLFHRVDRVFAAHGQPQRRFGKEFPRVFHDKFFKDRVPVDAALR